MTPEPLPPRARRAFDDYPQIEPSIAFNRAVLQSLEAAQTARRLTLIGRIEEMLGLRWWQFAASGLLGALLPAIVLGVLLFSSRGAVSGPSVPLQPVPIDPFLPRQIGPLYARELWRQEQREAPEPIEKSQGEELSWANSKSPLV